MRLVRFSSLRLPPWRLTGRIGADDFAEARAVDVRNIGEVQDDFLLPLVDEAVDLVLEQLIAFAQA